MASDNFSSTVLEHLMVAERQPFITALSNARHRMIQEDSQEQSSQTAVMGLSGLNVALGIAAIASSATGVGLFAIGAGGGIYALSRLLRKPPNYAGREGEQALWTNTEIKAWLTQAWKAGYPIGQILTAYSDFCEECHVLQYVDPKRCIELRSPAGFVRFLNQSPDQFSGLPPVAKIGEGKSLPQPLADPGLIEALPEGEPERFAPPAAALEKIAAFKAPKIEPVIEPSPWDEPSSREKAETAMALTVAQEMKVANMEAIATTAAEMILANPAKSMAWFGGERTGKSYGAAQVTKQIPEARIYHINLASYTPPGSAGEDSEYWSHAIDSFTCDLDFDADTLEQAQQLVGKALGVFERFKADQDPSIPSILIFDEWVLTAAKAHRWSTVLAPLLRQVSSLATTLSSSGTKRNQGLWLISPKLVAGELTEEGKCIKGLQLCYVAIPKGRSVTWKGKEIRFDGSLHKQLCSNYDTLPPPEYDHRHDRKAFIGDSWLPLGW